MSLNFLSLKEQTSNWRADEEEILINKLKGFIDKYENTKDSITQSFTDVNKSLERLEIGCMNSINCLKNASIKKFIEHVVSDETRQIKPPEKKQEKLILTKEEREAALFQKYKNAIGITLENLNLKNVQNNDRRGTTYAAAADDDFDKVSVNSSVAFGGSQRTYKNTRLPNLISSVEFRNNMIVGNGNMNNVENVLGDRNPSVVLNQLPNNQGQSRNQSISQGVPGNNANVIPGNVSPSRQDLNKSQITVNNQQQGNVPVPIPISQPPKPPGNIPPVPIKGGIPVPPPMNLKAPVSKKYIDSKKEEGNDHQGNNVQAHVPIPNPVHVSTPAEPQQPVSFKDMLQNRFGGGSKPQAVQTPQSNQQTNPPVLIPPQQILAQQSRQEPKLGNILRSNTVYVAGATALADDDDDDDDIFKRPMVGDNKKKRPTLFDDNRPVSKPVATITPTPNPSLPQPKEIKLPKFKDEEDENENQTNKKVEVEAKPEKKLDKARNNLIKLFDDGEEEDDLIPLRSSSKTNSNLKKSLTLSDKMASIFKDEKSKASNNEPLKSNVVDVKPVLPTDFEVKKNVSPPQQQNRPKVSFQDEDEEEASVKLTDLKASLKTNASVDLKKTVVTEKVSKRKSIGKPIFLEDDEDETKKEQKKEDDKLKVEVDNEQEKAKPKEKDFITKGMSKMDTIKEEEELTTPSKEFKRGSLRDSIMIFGSATEEGDSSKELPNPLKHTSSTSELESGTRSSLLGNKFGDMLAMRLSGGMLPGMRQSQPEVKFNDIVKHQEQENPNKAVSDILLSKSETKAKVTKKKPKLKSFAPIPEEEGEQKKEEEKKAVQIKVSAEPEKLLFEKKPEENKVEAVFELPKPSIISVDDRSSVWSESRKSSTVYLDDKKVSSPQNTMKPKVTFSENTEVKIEELHKPIKKDLFGIEVKDEESSNIKDNDKSEDKSKKKNLFGFDENDDAENNKPEKPKDSGKRNTKKSLKQLFDDD